MPLSTTTLSPYHVSYHLTGILRLVSIKQLHYDGTVWENEKYCGTTSWQVSVSRAFLSSQTFASVSTWYKQENIFSTCSSVSTELWKHNFKPISACIFFEPFSKIISYICHILWNWDKFYKIDVVINKRRLSVYFKFVHKAGFKGNTFMFKFTKRRTFSCRKYIYIVS